VFGLFFSASCQRLQPKSQHPHGLSDAGFDSMFTESTPVTFAYHGYPWLTYRRANHDNFHVHGFNEEGTTTTPFDMTVLNGPDRFHLAMDVVERVPRLLNAAAHLQQHLLDKLVEHRHHVQTCGENLPEVRDWRWPSREQPYNGGNPNSRGTRRRTWAICSAGSSASVPWSSGFRAWIML